VALDAIREDGRVMLAYAWDGLPLPIGGIAQVDGEWMPAELRTSLLGQTWVIWRYDWPLQRGKHIFTVRCFEGDGTPQIAEEAPPDPSGAIGLNTRSVML
jgi:hypothetical protein